MVKVTLQTNTSFGLDVLGKSYVRVGPISGWRRKGRWRGPMESALHRPSSGFIDSYRQCLRRSFIAIYFVSCSATEGSI